MMMHDADEESEIATDIVKGMQTGLYHADSIVPENTKDDKRRRKKEENQMSRAGVAMEMEGKERKKMMMMV